MITPSFALTATERVLPRLALDFTTAILDPRVTFTRTGNTATVIDSTGVIVGINADLPRFDFNPTTLVCRGLLIEEARTNALLNSLIDGTDLATQSVTVTAAARTLSFYGTGTVVLSGTHSATVVGTGAYPTRTTLTFTPTAGSLTLTVTGTVQFAQLETGSFATSFIPTSGSAVTRNADVAVMTGTNFSDWYNQSEGTFVFDGSSFNTSGISTYYFSALGVGGDNIQAFAFGSTIRPLYVDTPSGAQVRLISSVSSVGSYKFAAAYKVDSFAASISAGSPLTDTLGTVPTTVNKLNIGSAASNLLQLGGHVRKFLYYPQRLINAELQSFSK